MPPHALGMGVLASPFFDLAFLANYLRGLKTRDRSHWSTGHAKEM
jgi:hypothetical protein